MIRNRKADAQAKQASEKLNELKIAVKQSRMHWKNAPESMVDDSYELYAQDVARFNEQADLEGLPALKLAAN